MSNIPTPEAVHIGDDEAPFVDIGDGSKLRVLQVDVGEGLAPGKIPAARKKFSRCKKSFLSVPAAGLRRFMTT